MTETTLTTEQLIDKKKLESMQNLLDIQLSDGNWDADPYMHGMANGMIIMHGIANNHQHDFKTAPAYWKSRSAQTVKWITSLKQPIFFTFVFVLVKILEVSSGIDFSNCWYGDYDNVPTNGPTVASE